MCRGGPCMLFSGSFCGILDNQGICGRMGKQNLCSLSQDKERLFCPFWVAGLCHKVVANSSMALFIESATQLNLIDCRMSRILCCQSWASSKGIWSSSATLHSSSWDCLWLTRGDSAAGAFPSLGKEDYTPVCTSGTGRSSSSLSSSIGLVSPGYPLGGES